MTILIAEDEPSFRRLIKSILEDLRPRYKILAVADGEEALDIFRTTRIDILLSDIKMPGMDGLDLIKIIREEQKETAIILISGYGDFEFAQRAIQSGVSDYLLKPLDPEDLKASFEKIEKKLLYKENKRESPLQDFDTFVTEYLGINLTEKDTSFPVKKVLTHMKEGIYKNTTLERTANFFHYTPSYFSSQFKEKTGQNFVSVLNKLKLFEGTLLIRSSNDRIQDIARQVGYQDYRYFCKVFKAVYGCTPTEYRRQ